MKHSTAVNIAIDCMNRRKAQIAFDANLHKLLKVGTPSAVRAAKEYDRINQAIAVLSQQPLEI
jgi:hypothetical protein